MIQGRIVSNKEELVIVKDILRSVQQKGECFHSKLEADLPKDRMDEFIEVSALVYEGANFNCPVAAGEMRIKPGEAEITAIAVLEPYRHRQYGDFVVRMLIDKAKTAGINEIHLISDDHTTGFFQKQGFKETGKSVIDRGITRKYMKLVPESIKKYCEMIKSV